MVHITNMKFTLTLLQNKPCKKYHLHDTKQNHKYFLGVEIFESIEPKYIGKRVIIAFVKGGAVTSEHQRQLNKEFKKSLRGK